ncbi:MAG: hypothetical protein ABI333_22390 [bacterium]
MGGAVLRCPLPNAPALALALIAVGAAGCGFGQLQTARPARKGHLHVTLGPGFIYNKTIKMRAESEDGGPGVAFSNIPLHIHARLGLTDRLDLGLKLFYLAGAQVDTKINLVPPKSPFALSVLAGVGIAKDVGGGKDAFLLHVPLSLHMSYDIGGRVTPYVAGGYSMYFIYGRDEEAEAGQDFTGRKGHGDHMVTVNVGIKVKIKRFLSILAEYNYWHPVLDDPGDFFSFEKNHIWVVAVQGHFQIFGRRRGRALPPRPLEPLRPLRPLEPARPLPPVSPSPQARPPAKGTTPGTRPAVPPPAPEAPGTPRPPGSLPVPPPPPGS